MPKLIAKERFYYDGRNVEIGEEFDAQEQDVALLTNSISPRAEQPSKQRTIKTRAMKAAPEEPKETGLLLGDGRYRRADMRAED